MITIRTVLRSFDEKDDNYDLLAANMYARYIDDAIFIKNNGIVYTDDYGECYPQREINDDIRLCTSSFIKFKKNFNNINVIFFPLFMPFKDDGKVYDNEIFIRMWYTDYNYERKTIDISSDEFDITNAFSMIYADNMGRCLSLLTYLLSMIIRSDRIFLFNLLEQSEEFKDISQVPEMFGYTFEKVVDLEKFEIHDDTILNAYKIIKKQHSNYFDKLISFSFKKYFNFFMKNGEKNQKYIYDNCTSSKEALKFILDYNMEEL